MNPCLNPATEIPEMIVSYLDVKAGFTLDNPDDLQYKRAMLHRHQFGEVSAKAASTLRQNTDGEDHTDAVIGVTRAIDTYLLCYGLNRGDFDSMQKNYAQAREYVTIGVSGQKLTTSFSLNRSWTRQKENSRLVYVKRAHVYHSGRVYTHALYRHRSELDDKLLLEIVQLSLSPYTRVRR